MNTEKYIVSFNVAGWNWRITQEPWKDRLERACDCIKKEAPDAWLVGLSEVIPGKDDKYLDVIREEFPNYVLVVPKAYECNYRSAINVLLISREGYHGHDTRVLGSLADSLLYNYIGVNTDYGCFRVLNVHIPQTYNEGKPEWYQKQRKDLRAVYERSIYEECMIYKREQDIQFICMGDLNSFSESSFIEKLSGRVEPVLFNATRPNDRDLPTWKNPECKSAHIDYIFYSMGSMSAPAIEVYYNDIIDRPIREKVSDHAIIRGKIKTKIID